MTLVALRFASVDRHCVFQWKNSELVKRKKPGKLLLPRWLNPKLVDGGLKVLIVHMSC
jgi:hypothetical protein